MVFAPDTCPNRSITSRARINNKTSPALISRFLPPSGGPLQVMLRLFDIAKVRQGRGSMIDINNLSMPAFCLYLIQIQQTGKQARPVTRRSGSSRKLLSWSNHANFEAETNFEAENNTVVQSFRAIRQMACMESHCKRGKEEHLLQTCCDV